MFSTEYRLHYKKTLQLAYPVCISNLGHIAVGIVDTAMVGRIGTIEQAGVALANSLYYLIFVFGVGISFGVTPLVAAADAEKNKPALGELLKNSLVVNTVTGILLFILLIALSPALSLLHQPKEVVAVAISFLNIMAISFIPLSLFAALKQYTEGMSLTKIAMIVSITGNLLNVLFNYLLIFGHWGFTPMGVMGSCWASVIARIVMAAAMFAYIFYGKAFKEYLKDFRKIPMSFSLSKKILAIGVPSGLQWVFEVGAFSFAVIMVGWISPQAQAAHQIAINLAAAAYMVVSGIASAASVRVGNYRGLNDNENIRKAGFSGLIISFAFMCITACCFILFKNLLPLFFNRDEEVIAIASSLLLIAAVFQLADGVQAVALGLLRGMKDVNFPTTVAIIAYWGISLPCSYVFAFTFNKGAEGVWYGLTLGLFTVAAVLAWRFNYISKHVNL